MRQLAAALDKAHGEGIVHRDLKPENLFLAEREGLPPIVKILDFGVAKMASEADGHATATGQILGTPRYMAPEQATDAKQISAAADRFALGLITFRMLCGRHYFSGDNLVVLLRERRTRGPREKPSALGSKLGPAFDAWFARACALAPRERFATCAEQVDALAQAIAIEPARGRGRARAWVAALGACRIGGGGVGGGAQGGAGRHAGGDGARALRLGDRATGRSAARNHDGSARDDHPEPARGCAHADRGGGAFHRLAATPGGGTFVEAQGAVFDRRQGEESRRRDRFDARAGSDLGRTVIEPSANQGPVSITMFLMQ